MTTRGWAWTGAALAVAGCGMAGFGVEVDVDRRTYPEYFAEFCAQCHGGDATGTARAPDLTTLSARNGGTFPLVQVMSQIDGYGRGGDMPEFGEYLLDDRTVMVETAPGRFTPAPERLAGMADYLESLQR